MTRPTATLAAVHLALFTAVAAGASWRPEPEPEPPEHSDPEPWTEPRRTAICLGQDGVGYAGPELDVWSLDCGGDLALPCDRGTSCTPVEPGEVCSPLLCTCSCSEPQDCASAALYAWQELGAAIEGSCTGVACSWTVQPW